MTRGNFQLHHHHASVSFKQKLESGMGYFDNLLLAKKRLSFYRWKVVEELDKSLIEFESNVKRTGGNVMWANTPDDVHQFILPFTESNSRMSFVQSRMVQELKIPMHFGIPVISRFLQDNHHQYPDCIIIEAKFLIVSSGHVYYCTNNPTEMEALHQAKRIVFIAGIDTVIANGYELELAKNLYSVYETGDFGFPFETIIKPGKTENRHAQQVNLIVVDNGRSRMLDNPATRHWFYLMNFSPNKDIETSFFGDSEEQENAFHQKLLYPLKEEKLKKDNALFDSIGYARLSDYLPYHMNLLCDLLKLRQNISKSKSSGFFSKFMGQGDIKLFLQSDKFIQPNKFIAFVNERYLPANMSITSFPTKNFVEQYFYNKRKI